jgi:hypothetical protein
MSNNRAIWLKLGAGEEIANLLKRGGAILQPETHQAGNDIVEINQV